MKEKLTTGLIIALIAVIVLLGIFGGKKITKYADEIKSLTSEKNTLVAQNKSLEAQNTIIAEKNKQYEKTVDSAKVEFKKKDKVIKALSADLDSALAKLDGITSDSSYQFLQLIAYNYPGELKYLFNSMQIRGIHGDYLKARNSEKIIPEYKAQIDNCTLQVAQKDKIEIGLRAIIGNQDTQLANCEKINKDNETIIADTQKERDSERHKKGFWRFTTSIATAVAIVAAVFL